MTSRDRVLTTLRHEEPDRVPFNLRPAPELSARLQQEFPGADFARHFAHDVAYVYLALPPAPPGVLDQDWTPEPTAADIAAVARSVDELHAQGLAVCGGYACGVFEQAKAWLGDVGTMIGPYDDPAAFARELDRITAW